MNRRRTNVADMTITERLESLREYGCEICKYLEAANNGSLIHPETTTTQDYLEEHYCEKRRFKEI